MEVKAAEFARMAGVSRATMSGKIKNKTLTVNAAGLLDTENPLNAAYLTKHRQRRAEADAAGFINSNNSNNTKSFTGETFKAQPPPDDFALMQAAGVPARELLNMTLREIVLKYPGIDKIERYAKILKDATMTAEREQRMNERALTTIPKDFVISRVFEFLNTLAIQLIEYPDSAVDRLIALAVAKGENYRIEIIETMKNGISRIIIGAKETVIAELNSLKSKYQNESQSNNDKLEEIKEAIEESRHE